MSEKAKSTKESGQIERERQHAETEADKAKRKAEWTKLDKRSPETRHEYR